MRLTILKNANNLKTRALQTDRFIIYVNTKLKTMCEDLKHISESFNVPI